MPRLQYHLHGGKGSVLANLHRGVVGGSLPLLGSFFLNSLLVLRMAGQAPMSAGSLEPSAHKIPA